MKLTTDEHHDLLLDDLRLLDGILAKRGYEETWTLRRLTISAIAHAEAMQQHRDRQGGQHGQGQ